MRLKISLGNGGLGVLNVCQLIEAEQRIYASVNYPLLVQIMACGLTGAKPLSEPKMDYC